MMCLLYSLLSDTVILLDPLVLEKSWRYIISDDQMYHCNWHTMLGLGKVIFIFPILWKLATGSDLVTFKLSPISKKPPESDQLFQIETSTAFQCTVVCIQNRNCLTVMYDKINLLCRGYYNHVKAENLRPNVNAWQVTYKG